MKHYWETLTDMDDDGEDGDKILMAMFMMKKKWKQNNACTICI